MFLYSANTKCCSCNVLPFGFKKIAPNLYSNPNPNWGTIFLGGNCPDTLPLLRFSG